MLHNWAGTSWPRSTSYVLIFRSYPDTYGVQPILTRFKHLLPWQNFQINVSLNQNNNGRRCAGSAQIVQNVVSGLAGLRRTFSSQNNPGSGFCLSKYTAPVYPDKFVRVTWNSLIIRFKLAKYRPKPEKELRLLSNGDYRSWSPFDCYFANRCVETRLKGHNLSLGIQGQWPQWWHSLLILTRNNCQGGSEMQRNVLYRLKETYRKSLNKSRLQLYYKPFYRLTCNLMVSLLLTWLQRSPFDLGSYNRVSLAS